jgi:tetratricopeptide (TPR) repeat protein
MRTLTGRRPELIFLASLLVFALMMAIRVLQERPAASLAINGDAPAPAPIEASDERAIAALQERIRRNPEDTAAYSQLGLALLQRVRETADPTLYTQAAAALDAALKRDPQQFDALVGQGLLANARHQFADALRWGERARAVNPFSAWPYGIIGDAQTELGRYDAAVAAVQKMVDTRPDLKSYSRVSYMRELHGDVDGAIAAMRQALEAGGQGSESALWTQVQLGNLYFNRGDLASAEQMYTQALAVRSDYVYAQAGMARVQAARGQHAEAIAAFEKLVKRLPLPEFVIALGDLYAADGRTAEAGKQYALVGAMQQLNAAAGIDVDMELALFDANHGNDPAGTLARARKSYERRPSIYGADALAWALYRAGDYAEARRYSQEALRLGTRDAALHFRAGMIAKALGEKAEARQLLEQALAINPSFSLRDAPLARAALAELR